MLLAIDFDGTIVEHRYPRIGAPVPGAIQWLRRFQELDARLILWTMRSDSPQSGPMLTEAVAFCRSQGVNFFGVNGNPEQQSWTSSPKAYAKVYIDDAAFGCPLVFPPGGRPYVDWDVVGPAVESRLLA
jgi:hypothetical protein